MKAMVALVVIILVIFMVTLFWPGHNSELNRKQEQASEANVTANTAAGLSASAQSVPEENGEDQQTAMMKAEYEKLEQARRELKRKLASLKHQMWGMKFSPEEANEINAVMLNAHKFEKTPRMLGAFLNKDEVNAELDKVKFAIKSLEEVELMIQTEPSSVEG